MKLVYLEWDDASTVDEETGWVFRDGAIDPVARIFKHVGFITEENDTHIILTCAYDATQMAPRTRIPAAMVRRRIELDEFIGVAA